MKRKLDEDLHVVNFPCIKQRECRKRSEFISIVLKHEEGETEMPYI